MLDGLISALSLGLVQPEGFAALADPKSLRDQAFGGSEFQTGMGAVAVMRTDASGRERAFPKRNVRTLRNYAEFCPWVRAALDIIRGTIERAEWRLNPKDANKPMNARVERDVRALLERPDDTSTPYSEMQAMMAEDYLVLGHGVIEKRIRKNVEPYQLRPLDAARVGFYPWDGDQRAARYAYFDRTGRTVLRQLADPMAMVMINRRRTYDELGLSNVETLDLAVRAMLAGDEYTLKQTLNPAPNGALNLGNGVTQPQVDDVRRQIEGVDRPFLVMGGTENAEFMRFNATERELRILASMEWYVRQVAAVFQIPVAKLQLFAEKQNRASTETQFAEMDEGVAMVMFKLRELENRAIVGAFGPVSEHNVVLDYPILSAKDAERQSKITEKQVGGQPYVSINEARRANGEEPLDFRAANVPLIKMPKGAPVPLDLYDQQMYEAKAENTGSEGAEGGEADDEAQADEQTER